jgi:TonB-dependent SusC/RagA subfamily outer membrane receptor
VIRILSTSLVVLPSLALSVATSSLAQNGGASAPPAATVDRAAPAYLVTLQGKVTDKVTGKPLSDATISLEGTRSGDRTKKDGMYKFTTATTGAQRLTVKYIGYKTMTVPVTLEDGKTVTQDFQMVESPKTLEAMTSTASGEQRKIEVGHTVAAIKADSVTKDNVINGISDLLAGRVAGLSLQSSGGLLGQQGRIRIRGVNSFALDNNPIVIVDGVRFNSQSSVSAPGQFDGVRTNPLDDLNPNDIESIEVVKGPSAATLYGTDASNGVIVIKTKRGQAGKNQWSGYSMFQGNSINLKQLGINVVGIGTDNDGTTVLCNLQQMARGDCTQDRLIRYNPLANPDLTVYKGQPSYLNGMSFSGGTNTLRFFTSADVSMYGGPMELPKGEVERIKSERGLNEIADEIIHPNAQLKENATMNLTSNFTPNYDLQLQNHLTLSTLRGDQGYLGLIAAYIALQYNTKPQEGGFGEYGGYTPPGNTFSEVAESMTNRFITSVTNNYRMLDGALAFRGIAGVDYSNGHSIKYAKRGEGTILTDINGYVADGTQLVRIYTGDLSSTLEFDAKSWLHLGTSLGAQYTRTVLTGDGEVGHDLPAGSTALSAAKNITVRDTLNETIKYGKYIEQRIGLHDRLFLSYAIRSDGAATFGDAYKSALFPKSSISWNILKEPWFPPFRFLDQLRLRFATGVSGIQPPVGAATRAFQYYQGYFDGNQVTYVALVNAGNPNLQPEKQSEREGGADVSLFGDRLYLEMTAWRRENTGLLVSQSGVPGLGSAWLNLGHARLKGGEFVANITMLRTRPVEWTINLNAAHNNSLLLDGGGYRRPSTGGYWEGYGLLDNLSQNEFVGYDDANGNNIIENGEYTTRRLPTDSVYGLGYGPNPRQEYTYQTSVSLFNSALRLSTSFQRKMKYGGYNNQDWGGCYYGFCRYQNDITTSLEYQARALAIQNGLSSTDMGYLRYDNTSWSELSAAFNLPRLVTRTLRMSDGSMSISGRNLRLWAKAAFVQNAVFNYGGYNFGGDYNWGYPQVPNGRLYQVRVDLRK